MGSAAKRRIGDALARMCEYLTAAAAPSSSSSSSSSPPTPVVTGRRSEFPPPSSCLTERGRAAWLFAVVRCRPQVCGRCFPTQAGHSIAPPPFAAAAGGSPPPLLLIFCGS